MFDPQVDLALAAVGVSLASNFVQRKVMPKEETKQRQEKIKKHQERMKELANKSDAKSKNELEALEKELMEEMGKMMKGSTRMMMFSMVFIIPLFWFLGEAYKAAVIQLPFPIPWFGENWSVKLYSETNWIGWYVLCSLVTSLALNAALGLREKVLKKK